MHPAQHVHPKILVTSAAGKTGLPTALQLLEQGYPVRAFVRRDDLRAKLLKDAGAEIFIGDQYAVADMRRAMAGVKRAYHCAPTAANGLHFGAVFAVAAQEARLEHVVILAQWLSHADHPSVATREVWLNEELVGLLPDTTVTVNNVGWFADNYFMVLEPAAQLGLLPMPLGDGDEKKDAPPSNEDIAAVNVGALIDPASHAGKVYRPTGPELLSPNEIAAALAQALGRRVRYQDIPEAIFLKALKALEVRNFSEFAQTQLRIYADEYGRGAFAVGAPSSAVFDVTGRAPESFNSIARRYVAKRPEAVRSFGNKLRALRNFANILLTAKPDIAAIEQRRDHVLLRSPAFARDSARWRASHEPDKSLIGHNSAVAGTDTTARI
jgi:uncharacterized protein YbjT (DUF2867 family)